MLIDVKRKKFGKPTITTARVRSSLQALVDGQLENLGDWLKQTAEGIPKVDGSGNIVRDNQGSVVYTVRPDPKGAVGLVAELAEFVIPKLQRSDVQMAARVEAMQPIENMSNEQLAALIVEGLGLLPQQQQQEEAIEVEFEEVERTPEWLKNPSNS